MPMARVPASRFSPRGLRCAYSSNSSSVMPSSARLSPRPLPQPPFLYWHITLRQEPIKLGTHPAQLSLSWYTGMGSCKREIIIDKQLFLHTKIRLNGAQA